MSRAGYAALGLSFALALGLSSCSSGRNGKVEADAEHAVTVGVTHVVKKNVGRQVTLSSELVPFQEIDVYAKEAGYVQKLNVDYGSHVKTGQVMATLEIPELQAQLQEDEAEIKNAMNQVGRAVCINGQMPMALNRSGTTTVPPEARVASADATSPWT